MSWFGKAKDEKETERLLKEASRLRAASHFQSDAGIRDFIIDLLVEVCDESDLCISAIIAEPLAGIVQRLLSREPFLYDPDSTKESLTLKDESNQRERLRRTVRVLEKEAQALPMWRGAMKAVLLGIVSDLPVEALCDPYPDGSVPDVSVIRGSKPLSDFVGDLPHILTCFYGTFCAADLAEAGLFYDLSLWLDNRLCVASGVPWADRYKQQKKLRLPIDRLELPPSELAALYTTDTPFDGFFDLAIPIPVPREVRFEHTHIVGGTGHGKTQLLQYLIMDDLHYALEHNLSLVVLDPDGTLIRTISQTDYFGEHLLGDRCIIVDPRESERPIGLNLFDVSYIEGADAKARETIENNTIELFEYFFDALLGSELTGKQASLFRYLGLLLMQIPGGNIHTLRELMEDGKRFKPYMDKLGGTAKAFFETRFFAPDLKATKTQILSRLWGVLSNRALDRVFSATRNTLNLDQALQDGKIIFVHTSKEHLGEEGSAIFARMMVALLGQSLIRRAGIPAKDRTDTYIYLDEAEGVVDQTLVRLLAQVRKYRGAITLAHQHLDQLIASARAGILANTSIKLAGGISAKDATALAPEFRTKADTLLSFKKDKELSRFALFARNYTETAMSMDVPLGYAERCDRLGSGEYAALLEQSREVYGYDPLSPTVEAGVEAGPEIETEASPHVVPSVSIESPVPASPPQEYGDVPYAPIRKEGGGGARHQAICQTIKELGETGGFRASIEETILDGEGRVDVILRQGERAIAFEVSVTTSREHELHNVKKCLSAGFQEVLVVAALPRHLLSLERFIAANLDEPDRARVRYVLADDLGRLFAGDVTLEQAEKVVRGYRVRSSSSTGHDVATPPHAHLRGLLDAALRTL
jgi:Type IV secretion-system coupling protein DNA-binding domain